MPSAFRATPETTSKPCGASCSTPSPRWWTKSFQRCHYYLQRIGRWWDMLAVSSVLRDRHFLETCQHFLHGDHKLTKRPTFFPMTLSKIRGEEVRMSPAFNSPLRNLLSRSMAAW